MSLADKVLPIHGVDQQQQHQHDVVTMIQHNPSLWQICLVKGTNS